MSKSDDHIRTLEIDLENKKRLQAEAVAGGYLWQVIQGMIDDIEDGIEYYRKQQARERAELGEVE